MKNGRNAVLNGGRGSGQTVRRITELYENKIADIKANCDLAIEGRDVKIKELEKHNGELIALIHAERERQEKCDDVHLRKIAELEKENAELKLKLEHRNCVDCSNHHSNIKLFKAKEIIKGLLSCCRNYPQENAEKMEQAEQFLKADVGTKNYEEQDKILKTRLL